MHTVTADHLGICGFGFRDEGLGPFGFRDWG